MNCKRIIPDAITSCNLICGSIAVFLAAQGAFIAAFVFILAGAFFDFFDGLSARLLKAPSPIGVQLDSLADDITFGLAPAMMLFCYLRPVLGWWALIALLVAAFSALRLANSMSMNVSTTVLSVWLRLPTRFSGEASAVCRTPCLPTTGWLGLCWLFRCSVATC